MYENVWTFSLLRKLIFAEIFAKVLFVTFPVKNQAKTKKYKIIYSLASWISIDLSLNTI